MKADLQWWNTFLKSWNGLSLLRNVEDRVSWHIWTNASGKFGIGGYILDHPDYLDDIQLEDVFSVAIATRYRFKNI